LESIRTISVASTCDELVFDALYKKHSKDLFGYLYYKYGGSSDPEDKVQEAFLKLWNNCRKVPPEKAKSFLYKVANNLTLNTLSRKKTRNNYNALFKTNNIDRENPEFILETKEYLEKLQAALATLTEAQRVAFMMNKVEGKKHKEIAEFLGISTKAVEKRLYGAIKKLKKQLIKI
jgi:RNA polymerase sigma-70 factor (ECF subfamily)